MRVNEGQVRYAAASIAASLLENAAMPGHEDALQRAVRTWFPNTDEVDGIELRRITAEVRQRLLVTRTSVMGLRDRWVSEGKAQAL